MSTTKMQLNEKIKVKKKMSKAEMQLAIIKKKQCDAKALAIIEQLLEPNVSSDWLIQNLKFLNKGHMEDVIEERSIVKVCGYVLCSQPLTVIVKQQYRISTRTNKVYDISKRKKFCSSSCYGASNYLLEQMLDSPLWLREKEDIPVFKILPISSIQSLPGDEIDIVGVNLSPNTDIDNIDENRRLTVLNTSKQTKNQLSSTVSSLDIENGSHLSNNTKKHTRVKEIPEKINTKSLHEICPLELCTQKNKEQNIQECTNHEDRSSDHVQEEDVKLQDLEKAHTAVQFNNTLYMHEHSNGNIENEDANAKIIHNNSDTKILQPQLDEISNNKNASNEMSQSQSDEVNNSHSAKDVKTVQFQLDKTYSNQNTTSFKHSNEAMNKLKKIKDINRKKSNHKQDKSDKAEVQASAYHNLAMHVEQSFREWVTKNTLCLLLGEGDEKSQLLENLTQQEKYEQLCKKLNRLQLQDEKEDRVDMGKNVLKPLPHLSVLQEEGKKIELKVRAFYEGRMTFTEDGNESKNKDEGKGEELILPLTDAHAPNALRRRIFLDKLNKILPDLLCALTRSPTNTNTSSVKQYICDNDTYSLIKLLVSTFHLTATNIVFKTAEWTLVGLIVIKMLSLVDAQLQSLFESKQASMYTSMILMSYKLDSGYLDRLVVDVINNKNAYESCNKQNLLE